MKLVPYSLLAITLFAAAPAFAQQGVGANYETRLSALEDEVRTVNGQVEQLGFSIRRLDQNLQRMQSDYDARMGALETTVANLKADAAARASAPAPMVPDASLGAVKAPIAPKQGAAATPQAPLVAEAPDETLSPQEQYDEAFSLLRQAKYEDAEKAFKDFIDKNPKDKMIDNAKYWHAETLYVRGKFAEAAVGFADAYQQNPQGAKAPDSLLKLAMTLGALNKPKDACTALGQLAAKYPNANSNVKTRAAEERTKLKCNG